MTNKMEEHIAQSSGEGLEDSARRKFLKFGTALGVSGVLAACTAEDNLVADLDEADAVLPAYSSSPEDFVRQLEENIVEYTGQDTFPINVPEKAYTKNHAISVSSKNYDLNFGVKEIGVNQYSLGLYQNGEHRDDNGAEYVEHKFLVPGKISVSGD